MRALRLLAITAVTVDVMSAWGVTAEPTLTTTTIEIPQGGPTFPGGDRAKLVNTHCLICHSAEMVLTQPALPREEWAKEVAKMRKIYGAPVQDQDVPAIVDYLAALKPAN